MLDSFWIDLTVEVDDISDLPRSVATAVMRSTPKGYEASVVTHGRATLESVGPYTWETETWEIPVSIFVQKG